MSNNTNNGVGGGNQHINILKSLMSLFLTADGERISPSKVYLGFILMIMLAIYQNRNEVIDFFNAIHRNSSVVTYIEKEEADRKTRYDAAVVNQSQAVYSVIRPDTVAVYMYRPEDIHHFRELVHYEGVLPEGTKPEDYSFGINKASEEYQKHIMGIPYDSEGLVEYPHIEGVKRYMYTCPIFNRRNMYVGYVGLYWDEVPAKYNELMNFVNCTQAAREIGLQMK